MLLHKFSQHSSPWSRLSGDAWNPSVGVGAPCGPWSSGVGPPFSTRSSCASGVCVPWSSGSRRRTVQHAELGTPSSRRRVLRVFSGAWLMWSASVGRGPLRTLRVFSGAWLMWSASVGRGPFTHAARLRDGFSSGPGAAAHCAWWPRALGALLGPAARCACPGFATVLHKVVWTDWIGMVRTVWMCVRQARPNLFGCGSGSRASGCRVFHQLVQRRFSGVT